MNSLNSVRARRIIDRVGSTGTPPHNGFQYFTAGLDPYLNTINEEYFSTFVPEGGSAFKMVIGVYGGGKTHFLYCIRDIAWKNELVVSYVSLSPGQSPFHKLELVYKSVVMGIEPPLTEDEQDSNYEKGITAFIRRWYQDKYDEFTSKGLIGESLNEELLAYLNGIKGVESISFLNAIKEAFKCLMNNRESDYSDVCQWLMGEGYSRNVHSKFGILQRIDKTTAFTMIRSLSQWIKEIGYLGLVILLDEAERMSSLSSKQKELHLSNLRELIDECGLANFQSVMIFYAVPNKDFLDGRTQVYEALRQRVFTTFETFNPTGVQIELEKAIQNQPTEFLKEVGTKLASIFCVARSYDFKDKYLEETLDLVATKTYNARFGDIGYKRLFVQKIIEAFDYLRTRERPPTAEDLKL